MNTIDDKSLIINLVKQNQELLLLTKELLSKQSRRKKEKDSISSSYNNNGTRFYLNEASKRKVYRCIDSLKKSDPISGWFIHVLAITGCRGCEIQGVRLADISREENHNSGEVFYNMQVNVAKKRDKTQIRDVVISEGEFMAIMDAHRHYFVKKGQDARRKYLFQKTKLDFKDNKISIIKISRKFKALLKANGFNDRKSLHICRNMFVASLKSKGYNSFSIKEIMKYASTSEIDNVYGLSPACKIQSYKDIRSSIPL
ncbi:integrase (plasmid) [Borrelia turcica IST7]|uniref:Integrase n=1 Tax=Borrelia turcica IST7 TaxID=1104446 RepID=A0A386PNS8_9SPIR|nr:tyrosine-type recombinase/integrase [Borrelia turcica]AYE37116.1 integrase [Borrelia turcica IST7]